MDQDFKSNPWRDEEYRWKKEEELRGRSIFRFKLPHYEEYLECIHDLNDIFYENKINKNELIVIKMPITTHAFVRNIFYYVKVNNGKITYNELFSQIDEQSVEYDDYLTGETKTCIDSFKKINSTTYLMECGE